jgi:hypothetical protein
MSRPKTEKMDYLIHCYKDIQEQIRFSDTKASLIITANGVLLSLAVARAEVWMRAVGSPSRPELILLLALFLIFSTLSLYACLWSIVPSLRSAYPTRFTYFGSISRMKLDDYLRKVMSATRDDLEHDLAVGVFNISIIATNKYKKVTFGCWSFSVSVFFMIVLVFLTLF